jgi:hypothetical protein
VNCRDGGEKIDFFGPLVVPSHSKERTI